MLAASLFFQQWSILSYYCESLNLQMTEMNLVVSLAFNLMAEISLWTQMNIKLLQLQWCLTLWMPLVTGSVGSTVKVQVLQSLFFMLSPRSALKIKSPLLDLRAKEAPTENSGILRMAFSFWPPITWCFFFCLSLKEYLPLYLLLSVVSKILN